MIVAEGTLSWAEFRGAQYLHLRPRPWLRVVGWLLLVLCAAMLVPALLDGLTSETPGTAYTFVGALLYLGLWFFVYIPWQARRMFTQQKALREPLRLEASGEGLWASTSIAHGAYPWSHLHKWKEGKSLFLLYFSDSLFCIVPKRCFAHPGDVVSFRSLLVKNGRQAT